MRSILLLSLVQLLCHESLSLKLFKSGESYEYDFEAENYIGPNKKGEKEDTGYIYQGKLLIKPVEGDGNKIAMKLKVEHVFVAKDSRSDKSLGHSDPTSKFRLYSGIGFDSHATHAGATKQDATDQKVVKRIEALEVPFTAVLGENERAQEILLSEDEPIWSGNFKKSIANYLQLPIEDTEKPYYNKKGYAAKQENEYFLYPSEESLRVKAVLNILPNDKDLAQGTLMRNADVWKTVMSNHFYGSNKVKARMTLDSKSHHLLTGEFCHHGFLGGEAPHISLQFYSRFNVKLRNKDTIEDSVFTPAPSHKCNFTLSTEGLVSGKYDASKPDFRYIMRLLSMDPEKAYNKVLEEMNKLIEEEDYNPFEDENEKRCHKAMKYASFLDYDRLKKVYDEYKDKSPRARRLVKNLLSRLSSSHSIMLAMRLIAENVEEGDTLLFSNQVRNTIYPHISLLKEAKKVIDGIDLTNIRDHMDTYRELYLGYTLLAERVYSEEHKDEPEFKEIADKLKEIITAHKEDDIGAMFIFILSNLKFPHVRELQDEIILTDDYPCISRSPVLWTYIERYPKNPEKYRDALLQQVLNRNTTYSYRLELMTFLLSMDSLERKMSLIKMLDEPDMIQFAYRVIDIYSRSKTLDKRLIQSMKALKGFLPQLEDTNLRQSICESYEFYDEDRDAGCVGLLFAPASSKFFLPDAMYMMFQCSSNGLPFLPMAVRLDLMNLQNVFAGPGVKDKPIVRMQVFLDGNMGVYFGEHSPKQYFQMYESFTKGDISGVFDRLSKLNVPMTNIPLSSVKLNALGQPLLYMSALNHFTDRTVEKKDEETETDCRMYSKANTLFKMYNPLLDIQQGFTFSRQFAFKFQASMKYENSALKIKIAKGKGLDVKVISRQKAHLTRFNEEAAEIQDMEKKFEKVSLNNDMNGHKSTCIHFETWGEAFEKTLHAPCDYGAGIKPMASYLLMEHFFNNLKQNNYCPKNAAIATLFSLNMDGRFTTTMDDWAFEFKMIRNMDDMELEIKTDKEIGDDGSCSRAVDMAAVITKAGKKVNKNLNFKMESSPERYDNKVSMKMTVDGELPEPYQCCFNGNVVYQKEEDLFNATSSNNPIEMKISYKRGKTCDDEKAFTVDHQAKLQSSKTLLDHYQILKSDIVDSDVLPPNEQQQYYDAYPSEANLRKLCKADLAKVPHVSHVPPTKSCLNYMYKAAKPDQSNFTLQYKNEDEDFQRHLDLLHSLRLAMLGPYWRYIAKDENVKEGQIQGNMAKHLDGTVSGTLKFHDKTMMVSNFPAPERVFSMWNARFPVTLNPLISSHFPMCDVSAERVNILNDIVIPYNFDGCEAIISKDCSTKERYTLKAKRITHPKYTLGITFESNDTKIEVFPSSEAEDSTLEVKYNGEKLEQPDDLRQKTKIQYSVVGSVVKLNALRSHAVKVMFDGNFVTVLLRGTAMKGHHCGLCGNYNSGIGGIVSPPSGEWEHSKACIGKQVENAPKVLDQWKTC